MATSFIVKQLGKGQVAATTVGTANALVTNLTTKDTSVDFIMLFNTHTVDVTITLCQVNDNAGVAGTPALTDVFYEKVLPTRKSVLLGKQDVMVLLTDTGDTLNAYASVTNKINYWIYGAVMDDQV